MDLYRVLIITFIIIITIIIVFKIFVKLLEFILEGKSLYDYISHIISKTFNILLFILSIIIAISIFNILIWLLFNGFYINNIGINKAEMLKLLLYIFQLIIIGIGIYVGYINYKELIRKNIGDHFPKIKIDKENFIQEYDKIELKYKSKLVVENLGDNLIKISVDSIFINGLPKGEKNYKKEKVVNFLHLWMVAILIDNNVLYGRDKTDLIMLNNNQKLNIRYTDIDYIEVILELESYGLKQYKNIIIKATKENDKNKRLDKPYNFSFCNSNYL